MNGCAAFDPLGAYATQVLAISDCHAVALARGGWAALAGADGALAGLLAIFVALIGYRLMLGRVPSLMQGGLWLGRVALVLALVTQAPAYQTLVLDVALTGPAHLAGALAQAAGLGPVQATAQAAQADALGAQASALLAMADPAPVSLRPGLRMAPAATPGLPDAVRAPLHWASGLLVATVLAGWLATRLATGLLAGLGPVLAAGLLFAGTRGVALGWLRGLVGAALGQVAVALVLALELTFAQGQMAGLVAALAAGQVPVGLADGLLTTTLVFAAVLLAALVAMARVGAGLIWPWGRGGVAALAPVPAAGGLPAVVASPGLMVGRGAALDRRVERVAAAALAMERRETRHGVAPVGERVAMMQGAAARPAQPGQEAPLVRLGQGARRLAPRRSHQAGHRDAQGMRGA
jgi:type IV secretion system protein VirB6